ncbi:HEAT repeat domain-containing protein [Tessaracoccus coleopterorum]|uniref:HEAT repeat domain-containing protein n=1 Tax=Tessaracoccus coleopterorum TaxID=2714950 RepID=UPI001E4EB7DC|nr:HEAT repeat domain-containing protein [Tessaracoccus coleopterorum]
MNDTQSLIQALGSPVGTERRHAALALGTVRDGAVAEALVERIRVEPDSCVREDLTWAIVQHASDAGELLGSMLGSDEATDRRTAAHVMSKVGDPDHFERLSPWSATHTPTSPSRPTVPPSTPAGRAPSRCSRRGSATATCCSAMP